MAGKPISLDLKTRVAAIVLLLFFAVIWLLTYLTTRQLQEQFTEVLANQQFTSVSHTASEIDQKISLRFNALEVVAAEITPQLIAQPEKLRQLLENRPVLSYLFGNGMVVISSAGESIAHHPATPARSRASYTDIEYFREVMASGRPALGMPRIGRFTKKLGVGFAVPIPGANGTPNGVLAGFVTLGDATLFGQIASANVGKTGWLAVNDARYRMIVAISDPARVMQPFPPLGVNQMLDRFAAGYEGSGVSTNSQGREVLSSAKRIGNTGWFVQVVLPTDEAFEPIRTMQARAYQIAVVLSAFATLIVWIVIRRLLQPLAAAAADIRKMAASNVELHELPIYRDDEVGELLTSFNTLFTQRHRLELELEHQARTDALTGLHNRRYFMELAGQELMRATRYSGKLAVLMLDVDHFKKINDTYGHKIGDFTLQKLAETCRSALREMDVCARFGGEEFAILLPETDAAAAREVAERLRRALADTSVPLEQGVPLRFTVSIGIAAFLDVNTSIDTLLNHADDALYEAKHRGRDQVCLAA